MAVTYRITECHLLKLKSQYFKKYLVRKLYSYARRLFCVGFSVVSSGVITLMVYQSCVNPTIQSDGLYWFSMTEQITTGSLFATFGSAIIAVFTLYTSKCLSDFSEALQILMLDLAPEDSGGIVKRRWAFIPRVSQVRFSGKAQFFGIESVQIQFQIENSQPIFPLPTTQADFKDLPLLSNYLYMKFLRKKYLSSLEAGDLMEEYPAWDCVMDIYRSVLLYKASYLGVWIGVCFVLQSILFTFFYPYFYQFHISAC